MIPESSIGLIEAFFIYADLPEEGEEEEEEEEKHLWFSCHHGKAQYLQSAFCLDGLLVAIFLEKKDEVLMVTWKPKSMVLADGESHRRVYSVVSSPVT